MPYKPKSIEDLGLEVYLNETKSLHNDNGYDDFVRMVDIATVARMAREFNVDRKSIYKWVTVYEKELEERQAI